MLWILGSPRSYSKTIEPPSLSEIAQCVLLAVFFCGFMMQYLLLMIAALTSSTVEKEAKIHCARLWVEMVVYSVLCHHYGMTLNPKPYGMAAHADIGPALRVNAIGKS